MFVLFSLILVVWGQEGWIGNTADASGPGSAVHAAGYAVPCTSLPANDFRITHVGGAQLEYDYCLYAGDPPVEVECFTIPLASTTCQGLTKTIYTRVDSPALIHVDQDFYWLLVGRPETASYTGIADFGATSFTAIGYSQETSVIDLMATPMDVSGAACVDDSTESPPSAMPSVSFGYTLEGGGAASDCVITTPCPCGAFPCNRYRLPECSEPTCINATEWVDCVGGLLAPPTQCQFGCDATPPASCFERTDPGALCSADFCSDGKIYTCDGGAVSVSAPLDCGYGCLDGSDRCYGAAEVGSLCNESFCGRALLDDRWLYNCSLNLTVESIIDCPYGCKDFGTHRCFEVYEDGSICNDPCDAIVNLTSAELEDCVDQLAVLQTDYASLNSDCDALNATLQQTESDYSSLQTDYADLQTDYDALNVSLQQSESDYAALQTDCADLLASRDALNVTLQQTESDFASLQVDYDALNVTHQQTESDYASLQTAYDALNVTLQQAESDYASLLTAYADLLASRDALNVTLQQTESDYASLQTDYADLNVTLQQTESDYDSLQTDYADLQTERDALNETLQQTESNLANLDSAHSDLLADYASLLSGCTFLNQTLEETQGELEDCEEQRASVGDSLDETDKNLDSAQQMTATVGATLGVFVGIFGLICAVISCVLMFVLLQRRKQEGSGESDIRELEDVAQKPLGIDDDHEIPHEEILGTEMTPRGKKVEADPVELKAELEAKEVVEVDPVEMEAELEATEAKKESDSSSSKSDDSDSSDD